MLNFIISLLAMSLQASVVIVVVLLLRLLFQKLHICKKYVMLLWIIPLICLIIPWKISSPVGFWRSAPSEYEYDNFVKSEYIGEDSGNQDLVGSDINSIVGNEDIGEETGGNNVSNGNVSDLGGDIVAGGNNHIAFGKLIDMKQILTFVTVIWGIIVISLGLYSTITFGQLKKRLRTRVLLRDNVYLADDIPVPMVVGFIKPEIYIPSGIETSHMEYVIAHEQTHIRRKDIFVKMVAYIITCIHWFNPLVWLAYNLMIRDMEMACDEETILRLGQDKKKDYATALLQLATGKRNVFAVPLAFGEGSTKERILNILKFKKTKQILVVAALGIGILLAIIFLTKDSGVLPGSSDETKDSEMSSETDIKGKEILTFDMVYDGVFAGNVKDIPFRNCFNGQKVSETEGDFYYFSNLEYQGEEYVLQVKYAKGTEDLEEVKLIKSSGGRIRLYPLEQSGTLVYIKKWKPLEVRKNRFCQFVGIDESVYKADWEYIMDSYGDSYAERGIWMKYALMSEEANWQWWYRDYDGSDIQRIPMEGDSTGPVTRNDIIYYQTGKNEKIEVVLDKMLRTMIDPLMEASDEREYRIVRYDLEELPVVQLTENMWMLEYIHGYYEYEGNDISDMETMINSGLCTVREDGMIPFFMQGSQEQFIYLIIKQGNVYRMQRLDMMMAEYQKALNDISLPIFESNNWDS